MLHLCEPAALQQLCSGVSRSFSSKRKKSPEDSLSASCVPVQHELSQACEKRGATPFACFSRGHLTPYWQVSADAKDSPCVAIIILSCPLFNIVQLTTAQEVFKSVRGKVMKFLKVLLPLSERRGCYITLSHFYSELQGDTVCYSTV